MADELLICRAGLSYSAKTKIRYDGREYSDARDLPPNVRAAYEQALRGDVRSNVDRAVKRKFVLNGQDFGDESAMPDDVHNLCDDIMGVIENNGEVTLPGHEMSARLISKTQWCLMLFGCAIVGGGVVLVLRHF